MENGGDGTGLDRERRIVPRANWEGVSRKEWSKPNVKFSGIETKAEKCFLLCVVGSLAVTFTVGHL